MSRDVRQTVSVMAFGVGAFTQGVLRVLRDNGAEVSAYLTRDYGHYPPAQEGPVWSAALHPNPCPLLAERRIDLVVPMSIDWAQQSWSDELLGAGVPLFCATGEGMLLERDRDFARSLCAKFSIPFPQSHLANNRLEADEILRRDPRPYVLKNPLCSPFSPIHTIVCETVEETRLWLGHLDYAEGVFLQEYAGRAEAGHIALVSAGEIHSLVTNQEYKRAFGGNLGIVAEAPLGGLVERDPTDQYGLARELLHPLLPWLRKVRFHGPVQVTAVRRGGHWCAIEYNIRLGVTSGPLILRMLENPLDVLLNTARNQPLNIAFKEPLRFGCSLTLAGYGHPYADVQPVPLPVELVEEPDRDIDIFWNHVSPRPAGGLQVSGQRIADVAALAETLPAAIEKAYRNIRKIRCLGSYYRTDIGKSLWPPGNE